MFVFQVAAEALPPARDPSRRAEVRLVGAIPADTGEDGAPAEQEELAAVLVVRAVTPSGLLASIRALTGGVAPPALPDTARPESPLGRALTRRELDALRMLRDGASTREMARELSYSERTVKTIVHDVLAKLSCRTRAQAVAIAAREGII